jgi:excisionase family DNA binding protein
VNLELTIPPELVEEIAEKAAELVTAASAPSPYLNVDQAAEYLACKPKRIYNLCSQGRIPFRKDGSRTLLRREDLDAYLEEGLA